MRALRAIAVGLLSIALTAACVPGEMGEIFDFALDWADSGDPGLRAASQAAEEVARDELARQSFEQGFEALDAVAFDHAATLRPAEPRYPVYAAAVYAANGEFDEALQANQRTMEALEIQYPDASSEEIYRRWAELYLEAQRDLLLNSSSTRLDAELREGYCTILLTGYPNFLGDSVDGALYLATADYSVCE